MYHVTFILIERSFHGRFVYPENSWDLVEYWNTFWFSPQRPGWFILKLVFPNLWLKCEEPLVVAKLTKLGYENFKLLMLFSIWLSWVKSALISLTVYRSTLELIEMIKGSYSWGRSSKNTSIWYLTERLWLTRVRTSTIFLTLRR